MTSTINEAFDFFRSSYVHELTSRLTEKMEDDDLDSVVDASGMIDGDLLTGVDETAYSQTQQEYNWRVGSDELTEAFQEKGADIYDGIDYEGIIAKVRTR